MHTQLVCAYHSKKQNAKVQWGGGIVKGHRTNFARLWSE